MGGTAADTEKTTELIASNLELLRLSTGTQSRVITSLTLLKRLLFKYQGHVSAALVLVAWMFMVLIYIASILMDHHKRTHTKQWDRDRWQPWQYLKADISQIWRKLKLWS